MIGYNLIQVNLTYKCNRDCSYCYAKNLKEDYEHDMTMDDYKLLLEWFEKNNIKKFNILGGEPTLHPDIREMLMLAKQKGFGVTAFTNCLFPESFWGNIEYLDGFLVNYNHIDTYSSKDYETMHNNLECIKQKNKRLTLAFNITKEIESCDYVIEAAKKYNANGVNMDLIIPNSLKNNEYISCHEFWKYKPKIMGFLKKFNENKIPVKFTRPLPLCIFGREIRENRKVLKSTCSVGHGVISINPDLTTFVCLSIFFKGPRITSFGNFNSVSLFYRRAISDLKWKRGIYPKCASCLYLRKKKCQGSCLCYKCTPFEIIDKPAYRIYSQYNLAEIESSIKMTDSAVELLNKVFKNPQNRFKIYLFNNRDDMLYYSGVYHYPDWVTGFASKNTYYQYKPNIGNRIVHELCHIYINNFKKGQIPLWLEEGFCEYITYNDGWDSKLKKVMKTKSLIPFESLFDRDRMSLLKHDADQIDINIAYIQSGSMVSHLVRKFGNGFVMNLLKAEYADFKEYFKQSTGCKFEDVEKEWLLSIKGN